jgi:nucleolar protein 56
MNRNPVYSMNYTLTDSVSTYVFDAHGELVQTLPLGQDVPDSVRAIDAVLETPILMKMFGSLPHTLVSQDTYVTHARDVVLKAVDWDTYVILASNSIEELDKTINLHAKRLREWVEWSIPEYSRQVEDHEVFARQLSAGEKQSEIEANEVPQIQALATMIVTLCELRNQQKQYVEVQMNQYLPNFTKLAGSQIGAKLLSLAHSAHQLAKMTSSTIQVLGAEKALFRHIKTGSRPPKHGVIFSHPLVAKSPTKGKVARSLANALAIAVRADVYGHGKIVPNLEVKQ